MLYMWMTFSMSYKIMKTKWYKKRNWYFIACIWDTSDTSAWYNDYAGSRRSAGQFNKIFLSSIGLNTQWGFFWCLKINDFQPKPRVCLWPRDWEGNQAWSDASADHVHLRPWIWNRKQEKFLFTTGYCRDASDIWEPGLWKNEKGRSGVCFGGLLETIPQKSIW